MLVIGAVLLVVLHTPEWAKCEEDLKRIHTHCCMWSTGSAEDFPPSLAAIASRYPKDSVVSRFPRYHYVVGLNIASGDEYVLCYCNKEHHKGKGGAILFVDRTIQWFPAEKFDKIVHDGKRMKAPTKP